MDSDCVEYFKHTFACVPAMVFDGSWQQRIRSDLAGYMFLGENKGCPQTADVPLLVVLLDGVDEASSLASLLKVWEVSFTNLAIMR